MKFIRKELYDLVWSDPLTSIAKKFETSDYDLRKLVKILIYPCLNQGME